MTLWPLHEFPGFADVDDSFQVVVAAAVVVDGTLMGGSTIYGRDMQKNDFFEPRGLR